VMWTAAGDRKRVQFWAARLWRLVPLYWLLTGTFLAGTVLFPRVALTTRVFDGVYILKSFFFIPALDPSTGGIAPFYSIGWTLNYEMFFYLVFGLTLFAQSRARRFICLLVAFAALIAVGWFITPTNPVAFFYTRAYLLEFLAGVVIGIAAQRLMAAKAAGAIGFALATIALAATPAFADTDARWWVIAAASACLVAGSLSFEAFARRHPLPWLQLAGDASYSMYLVHPLFQRAAYLALLLVLGIEGPIKLAIYSMVTFAVGILGGIATYYVIERPILNLRKTRRRPAGAAVAATTSST